MKTKNPLSNADDLFRAFSDRTRLRILNLLQGGELCVCDLVRVINAPQPTVSRHLAYLRRAGLVRARKEGLWMYYTLSPARTKLHQKLMECLECCSVPELKEDRRELRNQPGRECE